MLRVAGSIPSRGCIDLYCAPGAQEVLPMRVGGAIGSAVSDAILCCWLWSTATRVVHWTTSVAVLQVVDN